MSAQRNDGSVQVLNKAMLLLQLLSEHSEMTAAQLAERSGEPRSSVYRLLGTLQEMDAVEVGSRRGTYRLGLALLRLGSTIIARFDERQEALPALERLHKATGETVFLCIRRNWDAVCIERLEGERVQSLALRLGGALPLHAGAAPRVLLAYEDREVWNEYTAERKLESFAPGTPTTKRALFAELEEIRETGYAVSDQDVTPGIAAIGAPVFDYKGAIRGAISISGTRPMILDDRKRSIKLVVEAAKSTSSALGFDASDTPLALRK